MQTRRPRGYLLVVTLLVTGVLIVFASALVSHQRTESGMAVRSEHDLVAEEAARAGIQDAMYQLKQSSSWTTGFTDEKLPHSGATYTLTFQSGATYYSTNNSSGASAVTGYGGRSVPAGAVHLVSVGEYGRVENVQQALVTASTSPFSRALFGAESLDMSAKVVVDSYNSSTGAYDPDNPGHNADVGVNVGSDGAVKLHNVEIYGTIAVGPGGSESTTIDSSGKPYYEGFEVMGTALSMPDPSPPTGTSQGAVDVSGQSTEQLAPGTYDSLTVGSGAVVELSPGDYVIKGDVELQSGASLKVTSGPVNLYILGDFTARGQGTLDNQTGLASNLIVYGGTDDQTWDLRGLSTTEMTYALYAPHADVEFGGGTEIYGAFVAKTVAFDGNAKVHYDEALGSLGGGGVEARAQW